MKKYAFTALLVAVAAAGMGLLAAASMDSDERTVIRAEVGPHFASVEDGLGPGDALAGATLRLYRGETVVLETVLDEDGSASVDPEAGTYDVEVHLDGAAPGGYCFWGGHEWNVAFPGPTLVLEAGYICAGG